MSNRETYPQPKHGWTCYHCGDTFTTWGSAEDHFGKTPGAKPGCLIKIQFGNEMGLLMELRKAEVLTEEMLQRALAAEAEAEQLHGENQALKGAARCHSADELRMHLDSLEGRVVTANALIEGFREKDPQLFAEIIG